MMKETYGQFAQLTRKRFKAYDDVRDRGMTVPGSIRRFDNIPYDSCGDLLDVYLRKDAQGLQKAIVSIHGGAYVYGDKERYQYYCMDLAERGFAVVNFSYRLAPEHPYPAVLEDVNAVFHWIFKNGKNYGIDPDQLFVVGDSAGAQLAHQYLVMLTNPGYASLFSFFPAPLKIRACALNCGMYDVKNLMKKEEHRKIFAAFYQDREAEFAAQLDVLGHTTSDFPPAFVMTSFYDTLRPEAQPLVQTLREKSVPHKFVLYGKEGDTHMSHVFHLNIRMPEAAACNADECAFFRKFSSCGNQS